MAAYEKEKWERPKEVPPITKYFQWLEGETTAKVVCTGTRREMKGNPARSPSEAASPQGDAVS